MSKKKKIIVLSCMIALLAVTAVFNFILTADVNNVKDTVAVSSASYFSQYRTERVSTRNEELLQLDSVLTAAENGTDEYNSALTMKIQLTAMTEKEMLLENLIKAYGFQDVVVVMGLESDNVNVIAKSDELTTNDAVLIYTIINEETAIAPENVKIIPIS